MTKLFEIENDENEKNYFLKRAFECMWFRDIVETNDEIQRIEYLKSAAKCLWWIRTDGAIAHYESKQNWLKFEIIH